jgi:hypothetical protein
MSTTEAAPHGRLRILPLATPWTAWLAVLALTVPWIGATPAAIVGHRTNRREVTAGRS